MQEMITTIKDSCKEVDDDKTAKIIFRRRGNGWASAQAGSIKRYSIMMKILQKIDSCSTIHQRTLP